jgi:N-acylneuraminate cytidylyltransferase
VVFDFDGVFTDNHVLVLQDGREAVRCDRGDGQGIAELKRLGLPILVLSTEGNPVVSARCNKLGIVCRQGVKEKLSALMSWLNENHLRPADVVYVGNDLNDLSCLQAVGCGVATSDAYPEAKAAARIVLSSPGGSGAVREIIELILHSAFQ